jgi:hypothetical protein
MSLQIVDFEHRCGHIVSVEFNVKNGESFFVGFIAGASKGHDCPECSRRTAEENASRVQEMLKMVSPGHLEMRKKRLKEIFEMVKSVVFGETVKFGVRRFEGTPSTRFVGHRVSAFRKIEGSKFF